MYISTGIMYEFLPMNHNKEQCFPSAENNRNFLLFTKPIFLKKDLYLKDNRLLNYIGL